MSRSDLGPRYTDQGGEEEEDHESEEQLQHRILTAALEFVPAHGWTAEAIAEGAQVCMLRVGGPTKTSQGRVPLARAKGLACLPAQLGTPLHCRVFSWAGGAGSFPVKWKWVHF